MGGIGVGKREKGGGRRKEEGAGGVKGEGKRVKGGGRGSLQIGATSRKTIMLSLGSYAYCTARFWFSANGTSNSRGLYSSYGAQKS